MPTPAAPPHEEPIDTQAPDADRTPWLPPESWHDTLDTQVNDALTTPWVPPISAHGVVPGEAQVPAGPSSSPPMPPGRLQPNIITQLPDTSEPGKPSVVVQGAVPVVTGAPDDDLDPERDEPRRYLIRLLI